MPVYTFQCGLGHPAFNKIMTVEEYRKCGGTSFCSVSVCSAVARRTRKPASSQSMEVLDDGIRPQRIERLADAERIFKEREEAHDQKYAIDDPEE